MQDIDCCICRKKTNFEVVYKSNFNLDDISPKIFTSRRIPDKVHFRIVRCLKCGLVFSNPIASSVKIIDVYKKSYNPTDDVTNSGKVYAMYLKDVLNKLSKHKRLLDIGCGNGFFLKEALKLGFREVYGIEPSKDAVRNLVSGVYKKNIIGNIFKKGQFKKDFFDVICFFQVFDHLLNPNNFLTNCNYILKPGGYILAIMHNVDSLQARILGERSPIFDIQHIYLFNKKNIRRIFENNSFIVEKVISSTTIYSLGYWIKMFPLIKFIRQFVINHENWPLFKLIIPFKVGNILIIARKNE